jgi:acyl carrier protein
MPTYQDILAQTYEVLERFSKGQQIDEETELATELGLDSVQVMELLLETEDRLDISIPLNILASVRTVGDLAQQLQQLVDRG